MKIITKLSILFFLISAALYGQWALWGNPSLPGGNSNKGLGANKGELYYSLVQSNQHIDWWHDPVPGEDFVHKGNLITSILRPGIIYGLDDKINLSISTVLGIRSMGFKGNNISAHHRNENSATDFDNANGGILGDSRFTLNYLLKNTGVGDGYRVILGGGITIPSKNTLIKSPFIKINNTHEPHRHFSMSKGTYNTISEIQIYYKQSANPVFIGGNISYEKPIAENEYYYTPQTSLKSVFSVIYKRFDTLDGSLDLSFGIESLSEEYWNGVPSPNSSALILTPSVGYLFSTKKGAIGINIQRPIFLEGSFSAYAGDMDQGTSVWQIVLSFRSMASKLN